MYDLLSRLYTSSEGLRPAMAIHEELLRLIAFGDDDDEDQAHELNDDDLIKITSQQLKLLQRSYQRLGGWDKSGKSYEELYARLVEDFGEKELGVPHISKWSASGNKNVDDLGKYAPPTSWEFKAKKVEDKRRHRSYVYRASANWGFRLYEDIEGKPQMIEGKPQDPTGAKAKEPVMSVKELSRQQVSN